MTAPNLGNLTTITGVTSVMTVTTISVALAANPASSNQVWKINTLYVGNINTTTTATVTVGFLRGTTTTNFASTIAVPPGASLDIVSKSIYLQEADSLMLLASVNGYLQAICSYEMMS